jgi:hypothetical protein
MGRYELEGKSFAVAFAGLREFRGGPGIMILVAVPP